MQDSATDQQGIRAELNASRNRIGTWVVMTVLVLLLVAAAVIGYLGWTRTDTSVPISGYVAMAFGVIFSLAVGVGLMALLFYSSRAGYDEPAVLIQEPQDDQGYAARRDDGKSP
jgi:hypothetical protein